MEATQAAAAGGGAPKSHAPPSVLTHRGHGSVVQRRLLRQALQAGGLCGAHHLQAAAVGAPSGALLAAGSAALGASQGCCARKLCGAKGGQRLAALQRLQLGARLAGQAAQVEVLWRVGRRGGGWWA